ncbi:MAG: MoxR family ATPase [Thermaerobacter sp.]|nr:MoxR family ATPase [Thermaerobacter sp.]
MRLTEQAQRLGQAVREELARRVVGQAEAVEGLLTALLAGGHVLLEGVPGIAKTLLARSLSQAVAAQFRRIQFTPDLMPSDLVGTSVYDLKSGSFTLKRGPVFTNLLLADEINRATPKTQSALLEAMEEHQVTLDGETIPLPEPFLVVATQNPVEYEGTYPLPEAQLDRFLFKLTMAYPDQEEEVRILALDNQPSDPAPAYRISPEELAAARREVTAVVVAEDLLRYAAALVRTTRGSREILLGASPRAAVGLVRGSKARAALAGRDFALPEDVKELLLPTLRHRIVLRPEAEVEGREPDAVLRQLADTVPVPR